MDAQHTPTPWTTEGCRVLGPRRVNKTLQNPEFVVAQCGIYCGQGAGTLSEGEALANAALIAAAPELLAACISWVQWLGGNNTKPGGQVVRETQAAVAKAKGTP